MDRYMTSYDGRFAVHDPRALHGYTAEIRDNYGNVLTTFPVMEAQLDRSAMSMSTTITLKAHMTDELASIFRAKPREFSLPDMRGRAYVKSGLTSDGACGKVEEVNPCREIAAYEKEEMHMLNDPLVIPRATVLEKLNAKLEAEKETFETAQAAEVEFQAAKNAKVAAIAESFPQVVVDALTYYGGAYSQALQQVDPVAYLREQGYTPTASAAPAFSNPRLERMIAVLEAATNETLSLTPSDDLYGYLA